MKIQHDFHIHTVYSNDTAENATVDNYLKVAKKLGLKKLGFAEHFWDSNIEGAFPFYVPLGFERISKLRDELEQKHDSDVKLYFGCEVEYNPAMKAPAITEEIAEKFDFIIVPHSHSHETMPKDYYKDYSKHLNFIVDAYYNTINCDLSRYITAMAHPFCLVRCPYPRSALIDMVNDDDFKKMFYETAKRDIAVEINISEVLKDGITPETLEECDLMRMFSLAKEVGCKFTFGTDSHMIEHLEKIAMADSVSEFLGIKENDIADIAR